MSNSLLKVRRGIDRYHHIAPSETRARLATMLEIMAPIRALPPIVEDKKGRVPYR